MAAIPEAQSGLLADATKFTGDLSCEPLAGDVTLTTGVVAKAVRLKVGKPETSRRGSRSRGHFMKNLATRHLPPGSRVNMEHRFLPNHQVDP
jgi:hypothetical protein